MALTGAPLGSLFITTGVRDLGSIATLTRIRSAFLSTEQAGTRLLNVIGGIQTGLAGIARNNAALSSFASRSNAINVNRLERAAAATERIALASAGLRPVTTPVTGGGGGGAPVGGGGRGFQGGGTSPLSPIPIGLRGLAVFGAIGLGGAAFRQTSEVEQQAIRASFAASPGGVTPGQAAALAPALRLEGRRLAREFELGSVTAGAQLIREIAQIGPAARDPGARRALARAAAAFSVIEPETDPAENAAALFRLIQSTGGREAQTAGGLSRLLASESGRTGGLIVRGGELSAAGPGTVLEFVRALQTTGVISNATPEEVVGLATALSTIDPKRPTTFATAIQRITSKEFLDSDQAAGFAEFLGISQDEFTRRARTQPIPLFLDFVRRIAAQPEDRLAAAIATDLGLGNVRDVRTIGTLQAALDVFETFVGESKALEDDALFARTSVLLQTLRGDTRDFTTEVATLSDGLISRLVPALRSVAAVGAGALAVINDNPLLLDALLAGGVFLGGRALGRFGRNRGGRLGRAADLASIGLLLPFRGAGAIARRVPGVARGGRALGAFFGGARGAFGLIRGGAGIRATLGALGPGLATGGIGLALGGLGLLEPVFERLEGVFRSLSTKGGVVGLVFESLRRLFQFLAFAGDKINAGFDAIGDFFGTIFGPVIDAANRGAESFRVNVLRGDPRGSASLDDPDSGSDSSTGSGSGGGSAPQVYVETANIGSTAGVTSFFDDALRGSVGVA